MAAPFAGPTQSPCEPGPSSADQEQACRAGDRPVVSQEKPAPTHAPRAAFLAFRHPHYRIFWIGTSLWMMADNVEHVITYWVLWELFESPLLAGYAVISHWVPFVLFSVYFGGLADRVDCRKLLLVSLALFMSVSATWAVLIAANAVEVWHAVVLLLLHGMAGSLLAPSTQLLIHDIVGSTQLQSAVRLGATGRQLGLLLGPAVGGALMLGFGPVWGLFANVLFFVPLALWALTMPYTGHLQRDQQGARPTPQRAGLSGASVLWRELASNRVIVSMVALTGVTGFLVGGAYQAQMPGFAEALGTDNAGAAYTVLLAANAVGALVGGFALEWFGLLKPNPRTAIMAAMLWSASIAGFAATRDYLLAVLFLVAAGVFHLTYQSMTQTLVQLLAPPHIRGRVIGVFNVAQNGLRVGSGFTVGVLGSLLGVHWALGLSSLLLLSVTTWLLYITPASESSAS